MNIQTKYDCGDEVVYMKDNRIQKANVFQIKTGTTARQQGPDGEIKTTTFVAYVVYNQGPSSGAGREMEVLEHNLFRTPKELAEELIKQTEQ